MKTARFLLVAIGFGALTLGRSFAGEPSRPHPEQEARDTHALGVRPAEPVPGSGVQANRTHSLSDGNGHVPERSSQARPLNILPKRASANEVHQPALKKTPTAANQGLMMNKTANHHEQPAKLPAGSGMSLARSGVGHGQSIGATALDGRVLITSSAKYSAGPLDGAAIKRKP
jgi:hypothetical protein